MFDFIQGYQGNTLIDNKMMDQVLKALVCPNGGVGNAYATPRVKKLSNWMSNGEVSGELTFISYDNVEIGESQPVEDTVLQMSKHIKLLEDNLDKSNLEMVEVQNRVGPYPKGRTMSFIQVAITAVEKRANKVEEFVHREPRTNLKNLLAMYKNNFWGWANSFLPIFQLRCTNCSDP